MQNYTMLTIIKWTPRIFKALAVAFPVAMVWAFWPEIMQVVEHFRACC